MSNSDEQAQTETPAKSGKSMGVMSVLIAIVLLCVVGLLSMMLSPGKPRSDPNVIDDVDQRIAKVGSVTVEIKPAVHTLATGEEVYKAQCTVCHATGIAGAPKFGDAAAWGPRIATGLPTLEQAPIKGFTGKTGTMPPQSGGAFSDYEITRAVVYMANAGGAKFEEPAAPADAASAAGGAAGAATAPEVSASASSGQASAPATEASTAPVQAK